MAKKKTIFELKKKASEPFIKNKITLNERFKAQFVIPRNALERKMKRNKNIRAAGVT